MNSTLSNFHGKSFPPHTQYNCEDDPLSPPEGEATQWGKSPLDPQFRPFFQMRVYGHAPRGEGRKTQSARGSITIQYCPLQVFYRAVLIKKLTLRNPSLNALSAIARVTPSLPRRGRQPKGASPLTPNFDHFSDACLRPCSTGRGSTDPERPWLHHYPILSLTGFLQSRHFFKAAPDLSNKIKCDPD